MTPERQLIFNLPVPPAFGREDFLVSPANEAAVGMIDRWPDWLSRVLLLVGPPGSGKTHLAEVWRARAGAKRCHAGELSADTVPQLLGSGALVVEGLEPASFDETALFHLLNVVRESGGFALLTARSNPLGWKLSLKDLVSRLQASQMAQLHEPDDELLRGLLIKHFADRQISVDEPVLSYMVNRMERSAAAARALVEAIDRRSLEEKVAVTRAFISKILQDHDEQHPAVPG